MIFALCGFLTGIKRFLSPIDNTLIYNFEVIRKFFHYTFTTVLTYPNILGTKAFSEKTKRIEFVRLKILFHMSPFFIDPAAFQN